LIYIKIRCEKESPSQEIDVIPSQSFSCNYSFRNKKRLW